jgi:hypothetical protein
MSIEVGIHIGIVIKDTMLNLTGSAYMPGMTALHRLQAATLRDCLSVRT